MWHNDQWKRTLPIRHSQVTIDLRAISRFVSNVLNFSELIVLKVWLLSADFRHFTITNKVIRAWVSRPGIAHN